MFEFQNLFRLQRDIAIDLVAGEHVTGQQIVHVLGQLVQRFAQRTRHCWDVCQLFCRQVIEVLVHRLAGIDLVLDAVKAGHQQGRECQIGVRCRIGETGLNTLGFGAFGPWDTDAARPVARGIGTQNGCFETGDQTLVAVGRRVGEGVERFGVAQDTADEPQSFLAEVGVFVACEQGLAVFPNRHVDVHTRAVIAKDWLGHEGGRLAVRMGHVVNHVFVLLDFVSLLGQLTKDQTQLMLAGRNLVVVLVDLHAKALHGRQHLGAQVLRFVHRVYREVAALKARAVAHIAHLIVGVRVPRAVGRINFVGYLVDFVRELHIVEQEELGLRAKVSVVTDAGRLKVGFGLFGGATRVALIAFAGVWLSDRAVHADRGFGIEGVDISGAHVGHQLHIGGFNAFPTSDGRAVEHKAFFEEVFVNQIAHDGNVLQRAAGVSETDVDIFNAFILDFAQEFLVIHRVGPFGIL
ncbi:hypothetical protein OIHEL45_15539 [Sulfitobacter indolifex HEL-45]|uniref:Uncharacterized protein n=1 Tax=Sulfitobacter indolifex HEL-45 TaxID=391624 RepID=A0ABP2D7U5_9RHOB|nr:hypothetical protein OIHEL45_15539 [Sulfitobacter indolifex HEL-45]